MYSSMRNLAGMRLEALSPFTSSCPYTHVARARPQRVCARDNCRVDSGAVGAFACGRLGLDTCPSTIQAYLPNTTRRTRCPYASCARGNEAAHCRVVHFDLHLPARVVCLLPTAATIAPPCTRHAVLVSRQHCTSLYQDGTEDRTGCVYTTAFLSLTVSHRLTEPIYMYSLYSLRTSCNKQPVISVFYTTTSFHSF